MDLEELVFIGGRKQLYRQSFPKTEYWRYNSASTKVQDDTYYYKMHSHLYGLNCIPPELICQCTKVPGIHDRQSFIEKSRLRRSQG